MKNRFVKGASLFAAAGLLLTGCAGAGSEGGGGDSGEEDLSLVYSSAFPQGGLNTSMETWAANLDSQSDGSISVEFNYAEALVSGFETLAAVGDGTVDIGGLPPSYNPSELPLANILSIPFQTDNAMAQTWSFYEAVRDDEMLRAEYEDNNVHVLMVQPAGGGAVGLADPISEYTELDGKRLRAIGYVVPGLTSIGVESVAINPGEIYESIQRGVVDGYGGYVFDNLASLGLQEVAPDTYDIGIGQYSAMVIGMNLDVWNALSPERQEMMTAEAERWMTEESEQVLAEQEQLTCDAIDEAGGTVTVLPDDQIDSIKDAVGEGPVDAWIESAVGAGLTEDEAREFYANWRERVQENEEKYSEYVSGMRVCAD